MLKTILLCLLGLASLPSALCHTGTKSRHGDAATKEAVPVAVGFHLGQSYATSAAHFPNGSVMSLAKVPASDEYAELMERMVGETFPQDRSSLLGSLSRILKRTLRMAPSKDAAILARMTAALKAKSETALGGHAFVSAAVTAPWMAAWDGQIASDSIINDVLVLVGIEPVTWEGTDPIYLGETNSLLAASKRRLCLDRWCCDDLGPSDQGGIAFLISFTNHSLHTSFQRASCFYFNSWDNSLGTIDPRYGLNRLKESENPPDFWDSIREHLVKNVGEHARRTPEYSHLPFLVLVAGEAANHPDFTHVLREVVKSIPDVRIPNGELILSDMPTFAAARGAAFWMWMRLDDSYCDEWEADHPGECVSQYDMVHQEL